MKNIVYMWNPVYKMLMNLKEDYIKQFGQLDTYNVEEMVEKLQIAKYIDFIEPLQFNYKDSMVLVRYGLAEMQEGMWSDPNSIYRECRSIVIDMDKDELVLTPWRKFFNLDEVAENKYDLIVNEFVSAKVKEFTDKLDGSMQNARFYEGKVFMSGSQALDPALSWRLEDGYKMLTSNHIQMITDNPELTFSFEYISLKDAHVVQYRKDQEGLYLVGMRSSYTGRELHYFEIEKYAKKYNVPMTKFENITLEEALVMAKQYVSSEKEGWVVNLDGHRFKLKCDDYVQLHRMMDKLSSVNVIIKNVADETFDDLISKVPDNQKDRVKEIANKIFGYVRNMKAEIDKYYQMAPKEDRKQFMIWTETNVPKQYKSYVREIFLGRPINVLTKQSGKQVGYKKLYELGITIEE